MKPSPSQAPVGRRRMITTGLYPVMTLKKHLCAINIFCLAVNSIFLPVAGPSAAERSNCTAPGLSRGFSPLAEALRKSRDALGCLFGRPVALPGALFITLL